MFKLAFKQFKDNWKISIGVSIVLLASTLMISSTAFLMMGTVGFNSNHSDASDQVNLPAIALVFAVVIFLSIIVIYSTLNLMVKLETDQFAKLRILGFRFSQIRSIIYGEAIILLFIPLVVSLIVAKPLGDVYATILMNHQAAPKDFNVDVNSNLAYLYIPFTIILVFIVIAIAIAPIKKVSMVGGNDIFKKKTSAIVWEWIFGVLFIAAGLAIASATGKLELATVLFPDIFYVIGFALIGKYVISGVLYVIKAIFSRSVIFDNAIANARSNKNQNSLLVTMISMMIIFLMFSTDIINLQFKNSTNSGSLIFNSISILLTIVIIAFSVAVAINSLMIYFIQKDKEYDDLRIIGYSREQIIRQTVYEALILSLSGLILGLIVGIGMNLGFSISNGLGTIAVGNINSLIGMVIGIPCGFVLVGTAITGIQMLSKKIR